MKKIIPFVLYLIFIGAITFLVSGFGIAERTLDFLRNTEVNENIKSDVLIKALIGNYNGQKRVYILKDPILIIEKKDEDINLELTFHYILVGDEPSNERYLAILISKYENHNVQNLNINSVNLEIKFEKGLSEYNNSKFLESFNFINDSRTQLFLLDIKTFHDEEVVQIESIKLYQRDELLEYEILNLINSDIYIEKSLTILDNFYVGLEDVKIVLNDQENNLSFENYEYSEQLEESFRNTTNYLFNYLLIESIIVLPLTYFLFFHKDLMKFIKKEGLKK